MTSTFGRNLRITIFGEAQGPAIGVTCDGLPAGLPVDPSVMERPCSGAAPTATGPKTSAPRMCPLSFRASPPA